MGARFVVTAATVPELQRMAAAARRLAGDDGVVEAVALAGEGTTLAPEGVAADTLAAQLGGLADGLVVYQCAEGRLRGDDWAAALDDALRDGADGTLTAHRAIYGGVAEGTLSLPVPPVVCLFAAGRFDGAAAGAAVAVQKQELPASSRAIAHVGDEPVVKTVDLAGADIVVSVGRGFAKAEDIDLVKPLVQALGAELGCSRPIAEDFKWLPKERLVGLTGTSVNAGLYLALGISGQVQHLTGIKGARLVVAVNNDAKAPIVRNADYVIVGDLYKVVPELVTALGGP